MRTAVTAFSSAVQPKQINSTPAEPKMLNRMRTISACAAAVVIAACGGGDEQADYTVDSGAAQKGPLAQGSAVFVNELTAATLQPNGKEYTFRTSNNLGAFSTAGIKFTSNYLSTMAWGYYFDEITGKQSTDVVALAGLSDITAGADTAINVNALSSMAVNRITKLATQTSPLTFTAARAQAQKDVLGAFYIYNGSAILTGTTVNNVAQPANLTALDLSKNRAGDQMLAALSGVVMAAGANGNGVNTLLSQIAVDLGDDGLLNNSPNYTPSVSSQLCAAADVTDFAAIASNLNKLYGTKYTATDLSKWVDSSGCVDQVIDKFKFSASDVKTSTVSKSPAYVAGPDDVGQCFSVGNATAGASAMLYYKGSTTAVIGTQKAALGDSITIGVSATSGGTFAAFIRRSAPDSKGACPKTAPTSGSVRVQKYSISTVPTHTIAGIVTGLATGQSLTLLNNGGNAQTVSANGVFTFTMPITSSTTYAITVRKQPGQICDVTNGSGSFTIANSTVMVACRELNYVVSQDGFNGVEFFLGCGPGDITVDIGGNVYVANSDFRTADLAKTLKRTAGGIVSTLASSGTSGYLRGIAVDASGNVYLAYDNTIQKIAPTGVVNTLAESGTGVAFSGIAVDSAGAIYVITDSDKQRIIKISASGVVSTLADSWALGGAASPGSSATYSLRGIAVDAKGNTYVAETLNHKVLKISAAGSITTLAGAGARGSADGVGTAATFSYPNDLAVDSAGNVYVADSSKIRKITAEGVVSTFAGGIDINRLIGPQNGIGAVATFGFITNVAVDTAGNVYIIDEFNECPSVRKITPQ